MREFAKYLIIKSGVGRWLRPVLRGVYERRFWSRSMNMMTGAFPSYEAALRYAPAGRPTGWDGPGVANNLVGDTVPARPAFDRDRLPIFILQPSTFAVMLWLSKLIGPNSRIVDVGGASGLTYWQYRDYFDLPPGATWTVVDMPEIVARGRNLASTGGAKNLFFSDDLASIDACDVLMSLGCIQYMSPDAYATFMRLAGRARTVIINKLPLIDGPDFWTLQCLETSFSPYRVPNRGAFLAELSALGLEVCDAWQVPELSIDIPFAPEHHVPILNGMVLRKRQEPQSESVGRTREVLADGA